MSIWGLHIFQEWLHRSLLVVSPKSMVHHFSGPRHFRHSSCEIWCYEAEISWIWGWTTDTFFSLCFHLSIKNYYHPVADALDSCMVISQMKFKPLDFFEFSITSSPLFSNFFPFPWPFDTCSGPTCWLWWLRKFWYQRWLWIFNIKHSSK